MTKKFIAQEEAQDKEIIVTLQDEIPEMTTDVAVTCHLGDMIKEMKEDLEITLL